MSLHGAYPVWEKVIVEDSQDAGPVKFNKIASNDHNVLALDEGGDR